MAKALPQTLIEPTVSATTIVKFVDVTQSMVPATLIASGLATTEEVQILVSIDNGATSFAAQVEGTTEILTATDFITTINSPMMVGVTKDATAGLSGVFLSYHTKT